MHLLYPLPACPYTAPLGITRRERNLSGAPDRDRAPQQEVAAAGLSLCLKTTRNTISTPETATLRQCLQAIIYYVYVQSRIKLL